MAPRKAQLLWRCGQGVDILHVLVILFMIFGVALVGPFWHALFIATTICLQVAFLHCPMVVLANYLKGFKDPDYWSESGASRGLVYWLFKKFGYPAIIPIAIGLAAAGYLGWDIVQAAL
jgi:hypothetical protein